MKPEKACQQAAVQPEEKALRQPNNGVAFENNFSCSLQLRQRPIKGFMTEAQLGGPSFSGMCQFQPAIATFGLYEVHHPCASRFKC